MPRYNAPENEIDLDLDAAVINAAAFLDGKRLSCTTRWRNYIDWARLDMGSIRLDILGQLRTKYPALGLSLGEAIDLGLEPAIDDREHAIELTLAWLNWHSIDQSKAVA